MAESPFSVMKCVWAIVNDKRHTAVLCSQHADFMLKGNSLCRQHAERAIAEGLIGQGEMVVHWNPDKGKIPHEDECLSQS